MSFIKSTLKHAMSSVKDDAKIQDLNKNTVEPLKASQMTTDFGVKISDTDHWLSASNGSDVGPALLEDHIGREKIHRFDHERIPERVVHARGAGAHGYFRVFDDSVSKYSFAPVLTEPSRVTPIFIRFSTVQGSRGSADTVRDVRGFAIKMYTPEGNWDIVGNNIPVFFIQDAIKFPDLIHAMKPEPHNEVPQGQTAHNNLWDFVGLQPESTHMIMWAMSDRAIPRSYRMMQGFGVNTFTLINAGGERHFVKFHYIPELGVHSLVWDEALKIAGQDPDFHRKDLEEAIKSGCFPKWTFAIQTIPEKDEHNFEFDILDATKVWPEDLVPLQPIGEFVLNRVVEEYFAEVEQVAFCTSHVVPGIGFSDDPLLQGRNFSYFDTQLSRLGANWQQLPINRPVCPVWNNNRDGQMQTRINKSHVNYSPNRESKVNPTSPTSYAEYMEKVIGLKQRVRGAKFQEHYNQAQVFYNSLLWYEKAHLVNAFCFELGHCDDERVYKRYANILNNVDPGLATAVADKINGALPGKSPDRQKACKKDPTLSQLHFAPKSPTIATRRIAILVADGFNEAEVLAVRGLLASAKATTCIIGPRRNKIYLRKIRDKFQGPGLVADHSFEDQRSTMFDAIYVPSGFEHANTLLKTGRAIHWIREAFGHCKVIGAVGEGVAVVRQAISLPAIEVFTSPDSDTVMTSYGVVTTGKYGFRSATTDTLKIESGRNGFVSEFAFEISKHRCYERESGELMSAVAY